MPLVEGSYLLTQQEGAITIIRFMASNTYNATGAGLVNFEKTCVSYDVQDLDYIHYNDVMSYPCWSMNDKAGVSECMQA